MLPSVNTSHPDNWTSLQALLASWLHNGASSQAVSMMTPAIQQHLLDVLRQLITLEQEINLDIGDIEQTLLGSRGLLFSQAAALGSDRALAAGRQLWQAATMVGNECMS